MSVMILGLSTVRTWLTTVVVVELLTLACWALYWASRAVTTAVLIWGVRAETIWVT